MKCSYRHAALAALMLVSIDSVAHAQWSWQGVSVSGPDRGSREVRLAPDGAGGVVTSLVQLEGQVYSPHPTAGALDSLGLAVSWSFVPGVVALDMVAIGDGAGGSLVFTAEYPPGTRALRVHHQLANGADDPSWPVGGALVCDSTARSPHALRLVNDGAGGAFAAWLDDRTTTSVTTRTDDLYLARITATGALAAGWPANGRLLRRPPALLSGSIALEAWPDPAGGVLLAMHDLSARLFRYDSAGAALAGWPDTGLVIAGVPSFPGWFPSTAPSSDGGALLAWNETSGEPLTARPGHERVLRVAADGTIAPLWPAVGVVVTSAPDSAGAPQVVSDGAGGAFVAWASTLNAGSRALRLQHLAANSAVAAGWAPTGTDVVNPLGAFEWGPSSSNSEFLGDRAFVLAPDGAGGAYVAWDERRNGHVGVRLARYLPGGTLAAGWPVDGRLVHDDTLDGQIRALTAGGSRAFLAWRRTLGFPFGSLHLSLVQPDGVVPALVSLVEATSNAAGVHVEWRVASAASFTIERRVDEGAWLERGRAAVDGSGRIVHDEPWPENATVASYRLAFTDGGSRRTAGEVNVARPGANAFALRAPTPNPTTGAFDLRFVLPDERPAEVALFDMAGRRLYSLATHGTGEHAVRCCAERALEPGVYVVRLRRGAESRSVRVAVVR